MTTGRVTQAVRPFRAGDETAITRIMEISLEVDRLPGFRASEIGRSVNRIATDTGRAFVATAANGEVVGFCAPFLDDLRVHPEHRRQGHGERLVLAVQGSERDRGHALTLYVPQHLPAATTFARRLGFRYHSSLWQFMLEPEVEVAGPSFAADLVTRPIDPRAIPDLDRWVTFLLASFDGHPSPMSWTADGMRRLHESVGFDPTGILVVAPVDAPDDFVAFARVESHVDDGQVAGEIGLLGVVPGWRRRGLGRELLRWGVTELRGRGVGRIELAVEALNDGATRLYRNAGFVPTVEWPHWVLPAE